LAWVVAICFFAFGFIGIGLFTSIPGSAILLMLVGWIATHHTGEADRRLPQFVPAHLDPRMLAAMRERQLAQRG
jgi:hypothetical protein